MHSSSNYLGEASPLLVECEQSAIDLLVKRCLPINCIDPEL